MGLAAREFTEQCLAGALDDSDPDVPFLAALLWIGQDGRRSAAT